MTIMLTELDAKTYALLWARCQDIKIYHYALQPRSITKHSKAWHSMAQHGMAEHSNDTNACSSSRLKSGHLSACLNKYQHLSDIVANTQDNIKGLKPRP